jgi:calcium-dependent protein kinase
MSKNRLNQSRTGSSSHHHGNDNNGDAGFGGGGKGKGGGGGGGAAAAGSPKQNRYKREWGVRPGYSSGASSNGGDDNDNDSVNSSQHSSRSLPAAALVGKSAKEYVSVIHRTGSHPDLLALDTLRQTIVDQGGLTEAVVRIATPFGKPIEEIYDGVHDGPVLGSGVSGLVRLILHRATGLKYAVKILDLGMIDSAQGLRQLRDEILIMCQLDHPNIVRCVALLCFWLTCLSRRQHGPLRNRRRWLHLLAISRDSHWCSDSTPSPLSPRPRSRIEEVYESTNEIYIVQELCVGGDLFDRLDEQTDYHYTEAACARLVKQMLSAVRYLHSRAIVHRDLKLENFLFSSRAPDADLKMIDFGLSKHLELGEALDQKVGTPYTVAPEILMGSYDEKCDLWAIGVITYLLLSGETPFGGLDGENMMKVKQSILNARVIFEPWDVWEQVSHEGKAFVRRMLQADPKRRPTARDAQLDAWIQVWAKKVRLCARNEAGMVYLPTPIFNIVSIVIPYASSHRTPKKALR